MNHEIRTKLNELLDREQLPRTMMQAIEEIYAPLANRIQRASSDRGTMHVVGVCGAQGSGKSTVASILRELLLAHGVKTTVLALDDFYLPHAERLELARTIHPLLATRGVPGTHDVTLMERTLSALGAHVTVAIPAFDKASDDRKPREQWPLIEAPVDVVLLEGWCVGATPQDDVHLNHPINTLEEREDAQGTWRRFVNDRLRHDYARLFARIDDLILLKAPSFDVVHRWRAEQEHKLRQRLEREGCNTSQLMNDAALQRFIAHYERLTRHILDEMPARADVVITMDSMRRIAGESGL